MEEGEGCLWLEEAAGKELLIVDLLVATQFPYLTRIHTVVFTRRSAKAKGFAKGRKTGAKK